MEQGDNNGPGCDTSKGTALRLQANLADRQYAARASERRTPLEKVMYENLIESVVSDENVALALKAATRHKEAAAGIDKMPVSQLIPHVQKHWNSLKAKLLSGTYTPSPVRRVEIPKPAGGGVRALGIPTVMDRFIQHLLLQVLQPIFEPTFSEHSYGFRPGRSAHDAVKAAQSHVRAGKHWVVDFDISKFFDRVHHDVLMREVGKVVRDKRVLRLIGRYLRAGVMVNGVGQETTEGTPQGGPLSPLLANIYLTPLDREIEKRELAFSRYADDCNVYVSSAKAAERTFASLKDWIEKNLRLTVNVAKSGTGRPWERKFLGFQITQTGEVTAAPASVARFKAKVRELWRSCQPGRSSHQLRTQWESYVRGWWGYFHLASERRELFNLDPWIRRHIRKCFWLRWHSAAGRRNALSRLGVKSPRHLELAKSGRGAWSMARNPVMHSALSNKVLSKYGFVTLQELAAT